MMIYFACSIRGEQGGLEEKEFINKTLKELGHEVVSEIFVTQDNNNNNLGTMTPQQIYERDISWIKESNIIVADVSRVSLGVGFEIGWMLKDGRKVVALCREDRFEGLSNMIKGCSEPNFSLIVWKDFDELKNKLAKKLNEK